VTVRPRSTVISSSQLWRGEAGGAFVDRVSAARTDAVQMRSNKMVMFLMLLLPALFA
jgi:hypothetical protein